ncbi:serine carboxypeptidase [Neohortaea acidophila]|uniref:Carboxypeptidase n=1 Tax=Neohortaea acidophila TaxID=245834 RepID=A0A6A6PJA2_9PEZI|nr:serine carboxypeptidase [Neohortaea acidophila]KAF2480072.1 serine carboxypeptidase [Neohortaea acidophila]
MSHTRSAPSSRRIACLPLLLLSEKSAADYFIHSLPGAPEPLLKMWSGHVAITPEHHGNIFFWLYKNRNLANRPRTVIWLNGGPGCSSMDGALMEIGPYRVNEDGTLRYNDGSWDEFANLLFVDQPLGTGFSYVDGDSMTHDLPQMAEHMITFLEKWFVLFPEYMHDDLYIGGESYAGQYIPYIAQAILERNKKKPAHDAWNLHGLLIGNGWISGPDQYISYIPFAYETGILQKGSQADQNAQRQEKTCLKELAAGAKDHVDHYACELIMHGLNRDLAGARECFNVYDVRKKDSYPSCGMNWPPDLKQLTPYLRRDDVLQALHINPDKKTGWTECNGQVGSAFNAKNDQPSVKLLPGLLEQLPIILFAGDKDLICNHVGIENLINNLEWNGGKGMEMSPGMTAPKQDWTFEGEPAGQWQTARNLTYIRFYNSSHMVPFDYPRRTRDMLDRFMGVDISSIGGTPADSRLDGEKGPETSVGDVSAPGSAKSEEEDAKLEAATWLAYRRSGEAALVVVLTATSAWGFFVLRDRRRRKGYRGVFSSDPYDDGAGGGMGLDGGRRKETRDIEAAAAFDESELDDLTANGHSNRGGRDKFSLAEEDEDEGTRPEGRNGGPR